jgi:hypothetical protein
MMDAYAAHLAQVNEVQDVIASDDICNAQGQIIVRKGSRIDPQMVDRITRFKLLKPLEDSVAIENELNADTLFECMTLYLGSNESTSALTRQFTNPAELKSLCSYFCQFSLLRQKLTVLSLLMPSVFEQAMFCAWLGTLLVQRLPKNLINEREFFVAALCHDIGMVHINGEILNKTDALTLDEWKQIQSHPIIGFNIVKETPGVSMSVAKAVLEHHENLDGTGYPRGKLGSQLGHEGQLLNLLDSVNAIFTKHFKPHNRSLRELLPIMQINQHSRFGLAAKHLIMLLRELPDTRQAAIPVEQAEEVIDALNLRNDYVFRCVEICSDIADAVAFRHDDPKLSSLQNAIIHITMSIAQSGIVNPAYTRWLDQVKNEKLTHAFKEVEEAYLMVREIIYHIDKLKRQMQLYLEKTPPNDLTETLTQNLAQLEQQELPTIASKLETVWMFTV